MWPYKLVDTGKYDAEVEELHRISVSSHAPDCF